MGFLKPGKFINSQTGEGVSVLILANEKEKLYFPFLLGTSAVENIKKQLIGFQPEEELDIYQILSRVISEKAILENDKINRVVMRKSKEELLSVLETSKGRMEKFFPVDAIAISISGMWPIFVEEKLLALDETGILESMKENEEKFPIEINVYEQ